MKTLSYSLFIITSTAAVVRAEIDAGGGQANIGVLTNYSSIGGVVISGSYQVGDNLNRVGLIEILYAASAQINPDVNNDGLPDSWEQQFFPGQTVDPNKDSDGDGMSNRMEYIAGTSPVDRFSAFKPNGSFSNGIYDMPLQTASGRTYKVYASKDLVSWHLQQTMQGDGTQKMFSFDEASLPIGPLHSATHPTSYFFRVEVTLP